MLKKLYFRDLKPENILYESNKKNSLLKIIDFGTSKIFENNERMSQKFGTVYILKKKKYIRKNHHNFLRNIL